MIKAAFLLRKAASWAPERWGALNCPRKFEVLPGIREVSGEVHQERPVGTASPTQMPPILLTPKNVGAAAERGYRD